MASQFKLSLVLSILGLVMFGFQNCSPTQFSDLSSAQFVADQGIPDESGGLNGDGTSAPSQPGNPDPKPSASSSTGQGGHPNPRPSHSVCSHHGSNDADDSDLPLYACILSGPGKSAKLALFHQAFRSQESVVSSVCLTYKGCMQIAKNGLASLGLIIVSAEKRGYCQGNPNVLRLTDAQLQSMLTSD